MGFVIMTKSGFYQGEAHQIPKGLAQPSLPP